MTTSTTPPTATTGDPVPSPPALHRAVGWAAAAGTLPYLTLKALWLGGNGVGVSDPASMTTPTMLALNGVTAAMDAVVIVLALALTHGWGYRLPAWLLLLPVWVGTGFLVPMAVAVLPATTASLAVGGGVGDGSMAPWVGPMVYGGFAWQGAFLVAAFALHVRARWAATVTAPRAPSPSVAPLLRVLAGGGAALALLSAGLHVADGTAADDTVALVVGVADAGFALVGAAGVLVLVRAATAHRWVAAVAAWTGSSAMFSWGLFHTSVTVSVEGFGGAPGLAGLAQLTGLLGGFALAVAGLLALLGPGVSRPG